MSDKEYIIWENTWRHRILEELKKKKLDWTSLRKEAKLSPYALNKSLASLQNSKIIQKSKENGITVYEISGKYRIKPKDKTELISEEVKEEETFETLLSKVEAPSRDFNPTIESLSEDDLSTKFSILINSAENSIIVVSPFLDENTYTRKLLKIAKEKTLLLVTRPVDSIHWDATKHQKILDEFEKNSSIIEDAKLHAKLLVVDKKKCLISSMNLTTNSITKSKEYGVYVESPEMVNSILDFIGDLGEVENPVEG